MHLADLVQRRGRCDEGEEGGGGAKNVSRLCEVVKGIGGGSRRQARRRMWMMRRAHRELKQEEVKRKKRRVSQNENYLVVLRSRCTADVSF